MLICGIDIGKNYHEACVIDETGRQLAKTLHFPNTTAGAGTLMDYFHGCNPDKQPLLWVWRPQATTGCRYTVFCSTRAFR